MSLSPDIFPFSAATQQRVTLQQADFKDRFRGLTIGGILNDLSNMEQQREVANPEEKPVQDALYQTAKSQAGTVIAEKGISPSERSDRTVYVASQDLLHPRDKRRLT